MRWKLLCGCALIISVLAVINHYEEDLEVIVEGHTKDAISRVFATDNLISGGIVGTGMIDTEADGQDLIHNSSGTIGVVHADKDYYIQLGSDFTSSPGPDYYVYVSVGPDIDNEQDFNLFKRYELGPLKQGKGASYYKLDDKIHKEIDDLKQFSVVIWCKQFGEYIGAATVVWDTHSDN